MNKGTYGFPVPPNVATRVAPPQWKSFRPYLKPGAYNDFIVPQNVYQLAVIVVGGGGGGGARSGVGNGGGGGGGGFAFGIVDVVPGQAIPTVTVGVGGTSGTDVAGEMAGHPASVLCFLPPAGRVAQKTMLLARLPVGKAAPEAQVLHCAGRLLRRAGMAGV